MNSELATRSKPLVIGTRELLVPRITYLELGS